MSEPLIQVGTDAFVEPTSVKAVWGTEGGGSAIVLSMGDGTWRMSDWAPNVVVDALDAWRRADVHGAHNCEICRAWDRQQRERET